MAPSRDRPRFGGSRVLVLNPVSGDADHADRIAQIAADHGFDVRETESGPDIVAQAEEAAREADVVAVAGGDGTLTRGVRGLDAADAFEDTLFCVVPAGTGNDFATNVGVTDVESAFEVVESGDRRRIDLGLVNDTPFLNSCVAGLTAESSAETDSDQKERWGVLAYATTTLRTASEYDALRMRVEPADDEPWESDVTVVLIGNGRCFPEGGHRQANVEDGLLDVTVVESAGTLNVVGESAAHALGVETEHVRQFLTPSLAIDIEGAPDNVSVDGEITTEAHLEVGVRPSTLWLAVGEGYEPDPA
jgi:YegS/Rv2252/BmrU family lipid kinase